MVKTKRDLILLGHSLEQYQHIFALTQEDLNKKIIDCVGGFASFNAELYKMGKKVVSCDKYYTLSYEEMRHHIQHKLRLMKEAIIQHQDRFIWKNGMTIEKLVAARAETAEIFLEDYKIGHEQKRYVPQLLPSLLFPDLSFDLAVCSHFLFATSTLTLDFHLSAIREMCRVAPEVRIFPLLDNTGQIPPLFNPLVLTLQQNNFGVEIKQVPYELQKGGNAMLRVWAQACDV